MAAFQANTKKLVAIHLDWRGGALHACLFLRMFLTGNEAVTVYI